MDLHRRLARELQTIQAMVEIYCRQHHPPTQEGKLCRECTTLCAYAAKRLSHCHFQHRKPTCGNCPIHCYREDMQIKVRDVMRYSGPKMIRLHPILAILHLLDGIKKPPERPLLCRAAKNRTTKNQ